MFENAKFRDEYLCDGNAHAVYIRYIARKRCHMLVSDNGMTIYANGEGFNIYRMPNYNIVKRL